MKDETTKSYGHHIWPSIRCYMWVFVLSWPYCTVKFYNFKFSTVLIMRFAQNIKIKEVFYRISQFHQFLLWFFLSKCIQNKDANFLTAWFAPNFDFYIMEISRNLNLIDNLVHFTFRTQLSGSILLLVSY